MTEHDVVGIDVAKDKFDIAITLNGRNIHAVFSNDKAGHTKFFLWLSKHTTEPWVSMEATGHYSVMLADFLTKKNIRVSVVNPFQVKNFGKASLARNKNDIIDARIIQQFTLRMQPRVYKMTPVDQKELKELSKLLDMLKSQLIQLNNQLHSIQGKIARKSLEKLIKKLEKDIVDIEKKMSDLIANNQELSEKLKLLISIKGIGKLTACRVIALMPDVTSFDTAKQFAAYIGITPKQHQSGSFTGKTTISRMGDRRLRKSLYMAALVAKRHNKNLLQFVRRLEINGKTPKTIVCAVMRKLAHIIFAVLKNKQPFVEVESFV